MWWILRLLMTNLTKHVFQNMTEDLNLHVFNVDTGKHESKILTK